MTQRDTKQPLPRTPDAPMREPRPTPGPSYIPSSSNQSDAGQSQKSKVSEAGKTKPSETPADDSCGCGPTS